jgi:hypothetical protein
MDWTVKRPPTADILLRSLFRCRAHCGWYLRQWPELRSPFAVRASINSRPSRSKLTRNMGSPQWRQVRVSVEIGKPALHHGVSTTCTASYCSPFCSTSKLPGGSSAASVCSAFSRSSCRFMHIGNSTGLSTWKSLFRTATLHPGLRASYPLDGCFREKLLTRRLPCHSSTS